MAGMGSEDSTRSAKGGQPTVPNSDMLTRKPTPHPNLCPLSHEGGRFLLYGKRTS